MGNEQAGAKALSWGCLLDNELAVCSLDLVYQMYNNCYGPKLFHWDLVKLQSPLSDHRQVNTFIKRLDSDSASLNAGLHPWGQCFQMVSS